MFLYRYKLRPEEKNWIMPVKKKEEKEEHYGSFKIITNSQN